jgi:hypothetical protein
MIVCQTYDFYYFDKIYNHYIQFLTFMFLQNVSLYLPDMDTTQNTIWLFTAMET